MHNEKAECFASSYKSDFLKLSFLKNLSFQKVYNEKVFFQKIECLVKLIKKYFLKKLSVWLVLIKVTVWGVNYQKRQCIYKGVYFILKSILWNYFFSPILANNNLPLKIYCESIVIIYIDFNLNVLYIPIIFFSLNKLFFSHQY